MDDDGQSPAPAPGGVGLWALINRSRPIEPRVARLGCLALAVVYGGMAVLREDPQHPGFVWIRGAVALHGLAGALLARRLSFAGWRAYTVAMALLVSLGGGWVAAALGNAPAQLPLTGLSTFVSLVFLQTGRDVALVLPVLAIGHGLLLAWMPPTHVALASALVMLVSSLATGAVTGLLLLSYSARLQASLQSWRDACERERRALRVKSEFLNTMSHELRSPLHVIIGYADMLREDLPRPQRAVLERMRGSAVELLQLVQNTMSAARLESGKLVLNVEPCDVASVLRELADDVAALPESKSGVPVRWRVPLDLPVVCVDRLKLKEVVQNLVSNALKFTRRGEVEVAAGVDGGGLVVCVRDTGPGIPPEARERIFGMFERVEREGEPAPPGTGLGLYIARNLVLLMGGVIELESGPAGGACFTIRLPLTPAAAGAAAA